MITSATPTVTVIVPVYNDVDRLKICLTALAAQDYLGNFDVIVADNASVDDVRAAMPVGDERFHIVRELQRGSYAARNSAARTASGTILAFTDADCIPHLDWLSIGVARLLDRSEPTDAIGGAVNILYRSPAGPSTGPELYECLEGFDQELFVRTSHFAATANMMVPKRTFEKVGEFNASLKSGGDLEWGRRLHAMGLRLTYSSKSVVDHPSRPTWRELTKKTIRIANGHADLFFNPETSAFATDAWHSRRQTFTIWWSIWKMDWPSATTSKLRLASARSYAGLLELGVRTQRGAWRPTSPQPICQDSAR